MWATAPHIRLDPDTTLHDALTMSLFDLFQWLPEKTSAALLASARTRKVAAGGIIYEQGGEGDEMFRLVSGSIRLSVMNADGRDLLYLFFSPGDCFGTSSVVDGEPRPQTAEAFDAVELQVFDRATIDRLRTDHPQINDALLRLLSRHMRLLSDYYAGALLDEGEYRLAQRLVEMADGFGVPTERGILLPTRISQSELAAMVGIARQTANRILKSFQDKGWITSAGNSMMITRLDQLRTAAKRGAHIHDFEAASPDRSVRNQG